MKKYSVEIERKHIELVSSILTKISQPNAFLLGGLIMKVKAFLMMFPENKFRLTIEALEEIQPKEAINTEVKKTL
jgi:hypothetical protein